MGSFFYILAKLTPARLAAFPDQRLLIAYSISFNQCVFYF